MAYYIFPNSFRSLQEFRKNPHIKIPPKSPCTNIQSLDILKNTIFIPKRIFLQNLAQPPASMFGLLAHEAHMTSLPPSPRQPSIASSSSRAAAPWTLPPHSPAP
jgi:hypothetical protein